MNNNEYTIFLVLFYKGANWKAFNTVWIFIVRIQNIKGCNGVRCKIQL